MPGYFQYEREMAALVQQLTSTQTKLQEAQQRLASEEISRHQMAVRMSEQLKASEEDHREKQSQKDTQMKMIIQRWDLRFNPHPAELNSRHNACAVEYSFTNWASPTEFSLGY